MNIIIGGVERNISQVETYCEYHGGTEGMTVEEILDESRADRLLNKIVQKKLNSDINKILGGAKYAEFVDVKYASEQLLNETQGAYEMAKEIEKQYAKQAKHISSLI